MKKLFTFFFILFSINSYCQSNTLSEASKVSIITCGTGNESYSLYGHTGIRIKDSLRGIDIVYNYGAFDFETPNFILRFVKGDLQYFVTTNSFQDFEYSYRYENRSIYEQELNLSLTQKQQLFQNLNSSLFSDERFYTYKFIDRNCTTMVIDKINGILGEKIITTIKPVNISYRDILYPYAKNHYFERLGINLIFGEKVDRAAETLFLPLELYTVLKTSQYKEKPLVVNNKTIFEAEEVTFESSLLNSPYLIILLLALIVFINNKKVISIYFSIVALLGVFLCLVGFYSFHEEVLWNYNALLFNPLLLVFVYTIHKRNAKTIITWGKINLICIITHLLLIIDKVDLMLLLPFTVAHFIIISRIIMSCKKETKFSNTIVL
ncbi:DUF4105 domain-containing protein [Flavobacterium sp.]|jgi:hypothetical protein|uniref:lipoprotein N-acyltransferase Lnb domain-containing protein n=1 Tax=Flavobacterium sp. TaxID=239 RepID=UPI002A80EAD9|nr:DUF4105 domain-containing protein [Flavobacterium sp.]